MFEESMKGDEGRILNALSIPLGHETIIEPPRYRLVILSRLSVLTIHI
jgi:hypothetical protein